MKTFVDLSWIRGKAKCVLIDEIKHVADENNFTLKCESFNQFENANFIYFDTEKKEITDKQPEKIIGLEITVNNALEGKYYKESASLDIIELQKTWDKCELNYIEELTKNAFYKGYLVGCNQRNQRSKKTK